MPPSFPHTRRKVMHFWIAHFKTICISLCYIRHLFHINTKKSAFLHGGGDHKLHKQDFANFWPPSVSKFTIYISLYSSTSIWLPPLSAYVVYGCLLTILVFKWNFHLVEKEPKTCRTRFQLLYLWHNNRPLPQLAFPRKKDLRQWILLDAKVVDIEFCNEL